MVADAVAAEGDRGAGAVPLHVQHLPPLRRLPEPRLQLSLQIEVRRGGVRKPIRVRGNLHLFTLQRLYYFISF